MARRRPPTQLTEETEAVVDKLNMENGEATPEEREKAMEALVALAALVPMGEAKDEPFDNKKELFSEIRFNGKPATKGSDAWARQELERQQGMTAVGPRKELPPHIQAYLASMGLSIHFPNENQAQDWFIKMSRRLLPIAMGIIRNRLMSEDEDKAYKAAKDIIQMNGLDKRDAVTGGGNATIIIQMGDKSGEVLPWLKRSK